MNRILRIGIAVTSIIIIVLLIVIGGKYYDLKQREFLLRYIPPVAVDSLLKWTEYYGFEDRWLDIFSLLMTESGGHRKLTSPKNCKGYMQLADRTAQILRDRLREHLRSTDVFNTDFNIAGGILHFKTIYDTSGMHDILLTVELYNTGVFGYYTMGKRAPNHVKRFSISYTYYKTEWRKSLWRGMK